MRTTLTTPRSFHDQGSRQATALQNGLACFNAKHYEDIALSNAHPVTLRPSICLLNYLVQEESSSHTLNGTIYFTRPESCVKQG